MKRARSSKRAVWFGASVVALLALGNLPSAKATGVVARDMAADAGIAAMQQSWSVSTPDVNGDGRPDLMIVPHASGPAQLYRNDGGHFTRIDGGTFGRRDRHDCQWADVNRDGRLDAYCTIGAKKGTGVGPNELWLQQPDGTFVDHATDWGVSDPLGRGRRVLFLDVNRDGYPDLYVTNYGPRFDHLPAPNHLFINMSGQRFRPATEYGLDQDLGNSAAHAVDYNADGWPDILLVGHKGVRIYRNNAGSSFTDVTNALGAAYPGYDAALTDVDGDGALDLVVVRTTQLLVKYGNGHGGFGARVTRLPLQWGTRLAVGDANGDGHPDLYVLQSGAFADELLLGPSLTPLPIPEATSGNGDVVASFDYDGNGLDDFVVLNGAGKLGPVQLIAMFPA